MHKQLVKLAKLRHFILAKIAGLTTEELNTIPAGLNNNIIWNLGHLVAACQLIFYKRAGFTLTIDDNYITPFITGTKPDHLIDSHEIELIKQLAVSTINDMQSDFLSKNFSNYIKSENIERIYGIEVLTIEDAIEFLLYHEGYHTGKIISLIQLVKKQG